MSSVLKVIKLLLLFVCTLFIVVLDFFNPEDNLVAEAEVNRVWGFLILL